MLLAEFVGPDKERSDRLVALVEAARGRGRTETGAVDDGRPSVLRDLDQSCLEGAEWREAALWQWGR